MASPWNQPEDVQSQYTPVQNSTNPLHPLQSKEDRKQSQCPCQQSTWTRPLLFNGLRWLKSGMVWPLLPTARPAMPMLDHTHSWPRRYIRLRFSLSALRFALPVTSPLPNAVQHSPVSLPPRLANCLCECLRDLRDGHRTSQGRRPTMLQPARMSLTNTYTQNYTETNIPLDRIIQVVNCTLPDWIPECTTIIVFHFPCRSDWLNQEFLDASTQKTLQSKMFKAQSTFIGMRGV